MFNLPVVSRALSEARCVQNPLRLLWRRGIGGFCSSNNNNTTSSSAISDVLGCNRLAKPTKFLAPVSYCLGIQQYRGYFTAVHDMAWNEPRPDLIKTRTQEAGKIASQVSPFVVNLCFNEGRVLGSHQGSGTIIGRNGIILTCAHLLGSEKSAEALKEMKIPVTLGWSPSLDNKGEATVLYADFLHDFAIIRISPFTPLLPAKLGSAKVLCSGDAVLSAGRYCDSWIDIFPQFIAKEGRYLSDHGGSSGQLLSVTGHCLVDNGCDGGPLFNRDGEVVGIMTERESSYANAHAISIDVVSKVLEHFKKHGCFGSGTINDFKGTLGTRS